MLISELFLIAFLGFLSLAQTKKNHTEFFLKEHTPEEADDIINAKDQTVVYLTEDWCDACTKRESGFASVQQELKANYPEVDFLKINLQGNQEAWRYYDAKYLPHIALVVRGTPITFHGPPFKKNILKWLKRKLDSKPLKLKEEHLIPQLKDNTRLIFIGSPENYELFDEVEILTKIIKKPVYFTSDQNFIPKSLNIEGSLVQNNTFIKLDLKSKEIKEFKGRAFKAGFLDTFLTSVDLAMPELFSQPIVSSLLNKSSLDWADIPLLLIISNEQAQPSPSSLLQSLPVGLRAQVSSSLAVFSLTDAYSPEMALFYRYCERDPRGGPQGFNMGFCIVESRPRPLRYVGRGREEEQASKDLQGFLESYLEGSLKPFLKEEQIYQEYEGNVKVD